MTVNKHETGRGLAMKNVYTSVDDFVTSGYTTRWWLLLFGVM